MANISMKIKRARKIFLPKNQKVDRIWSWRRYGKARTLIYC